MSASHPRGMLRCPALLCALAMALLFPIAGCARATPTPQPVSISFAHPQEDADAYRQLLQVFNERYPYITVELRSEENDMFGGLRRGEQADVLVNSQFAMGWLYEQKYILNLTPLIEQDPSFKTSDFYPGTIGLFNRDGKTWAIPAGVDTMVMYYNQDLFDKRGVPYPRTGWTWSDFLDAALAIRDPEARVFGYAAPGSGLDALTFIYQHGGRILDSLVSPTRSTFDDPLTIEALDWYARLFFGYNVAPTREQTAESFLQGDVRAGIRDNQVGMWAGMLSERGGKLEGVPWTMRWGVVPLPRDREPAALTLIDGYYISARTQYPDACWKWISFLSQQMPGRQIPARKSLVESTEYKQKVGDDVAAATMASMEKVLLLSPRLAEYEEVLTSFGKAFEAIMAQQSTPEEAMVVAQQESKLK